MRITAAMVKELREKTGIGMMECKRFLAEAQGDMEAAIGLLRKSGKARAGKRSRRTAVEGAVLVGADGGGNYAMLEVNCETDFVSRGNQFLGFCKTVLQTILQNAPVDLEAVASLQVQGESIEETRLKLVAKTGENIRIRRFKRMALHGDVSGVYCHGSRIGVLVDMSGGDEALARDIAMHVAASQPMCISDKGMPAGVLDKERNVLRAQAQQSGKPAGIVEKMVQGRLNKFLSEVTLLGQPFVKDSDHSVGKILKSRDAEVNAFYRFEVGEGMEKKQQNFVEEVKAQRKAAEAG